MRHELSFHKFDESKVKRDDHGQFSSNGSGGGGASSASDGGKGKTTESTSDWLGGVAGRVMLGMTLRSPITKAAAITLMTKLAGGTAAVALLTPQGIAALGVAATAMNVLGIVAYLSAAARLLRGKREEELKETKQAALEKAKKDKVLSDLDTVIASLDAFKQTDNYKKAEQEAKGKKPEVSKEPGKAKEVVGEKKPPVKAKPAVASTKEKAAPAKGLPPFGAKMPNDKKAAPGEEQIDPLANVVEINNWMKVALKQGVMTPAARSVTVRAAVTTAIKRMLTTPSTVDSSIAGVAATGMPIQSAVKVMESSLELLINARETEGNGEDDTVLEALNNALADLNDYKMSRMDDYKTQNDFKNSAGNVAFHQQMSAQQGVAKRAGAEVAFMLGFQSLMVENFAFHSGISKAWSEKARAAALEARRRKSKGQSSDTGKTEGSTPGVWVTGPNGGVRIGGADLDEKLSGVIQNASGALSLTRTALGLKLNPPEIHEPISYTTSTSKKVLHDGFTAMGYKKDSKGHYTHATSGNKILVYGKGQIDLIPVGASSAWAKSPPIKRPRELHPRVL